MLKSVNKAHAKAKITIIQLQVTLNYFNINEN